MNEISDQIEDDLAWREREILFLKKQWVQYKDEQVASTVLLRTLVALLYAHYEGFCTFVLTLYKDELNRLGLPRMRHHDTIAQRSLGNRLRAVLKSQSPRELWVFARHEFGRLMSDAIQFEDEKWTCNLYPGELCDRCAGFLLPHGFVDPHRSKLRFLVERRNNIAHGQKTEVGNLEEYQAFENAAYAVMYGLACAVLDAVDEEQYVAATPEA